jgi:hypothetical protein
MKIILHVVINCILLIVIFMQINDITEIYAKGALEIETEVSELSKKIKSGEEVLSPLQYANILEITNDRDLYHGFLHMSYFISFMAYIFAVCAFYIGFFVGKKKYQTKE